MTLLELLTAGRVEDFNAQRGRRASPDLFAADLAGANLRGADLSGANLEKADLSGADLSDAVLAGADLSGADLTGADLSRVVAVRAKMREAYLGEATMDDMDLSRADLSEAVLDDAHGERIVARGIRLKDAEGARARFPGIVLEEARLDRACFPGVDLSKSLMSEASLKGAQLIGANLSQCDMLKVRASNASFKGANLMGALLDRSDLTAVDLSEADLTGARLIEADLGDAIVKGTCFDGAELTHARLDGVDLSQAEAEEAIGAVAPGITLELPNDRPRAVQFEDLKAAVYEGEVALYWENEDDESTLVNRVAIVSQQSPFKGVAPALPAPAELTLARDIVQVNGHFAAVTFLDRPGGVELLVSMINREGRVSSSTSVRLGYELAVHPIVRGGDALRVYGLSKRGPALHCHELVDGVLEHRFSQRASTARGLVGEVVATRGGVLIPITREGLGDPVQEPRGFQARMASSTRKDDVLTLAWLPTDQPGFLWARVEAGLRPEVNIAEKRFPVTSLATTSIAGRTTAFYCREIAQFGACGIWSMELAPGEQPREVLVDERFDIDEVRVIGVEDERVTLLATTLEGEVVLLAWAKGRARVIEVLTA